MIINSSVGGPVKVGTLRYIGSTDFAKGDWAGVELEEKLGKNDGSVGGKRYFQCEPLYGVFAPVQKVEPYTNPNTSLMKTPPKASTRPSLAAPSSQLKASKLSKQMSGSQESLVSEKSSIYSTASSALKNANRSSIGVTAQHQKNLAKTTVKNVVIQLFKPYLSL